MKSILFLPEAEKEMLESARYYESQATGLGMDYLLEVEHAIQSIKDSPLRWPLIEDELRRRLIRRFPFCLLYRIELEKIIIIAVSHLHRKPGYWKKRLK